MNKLLLYFIVFICGGAVLAIEILGTRIIGPFYGVSLFLWSALISVTLIALSIGYMTGGRIADKRKSYKVLAFIILLSGLIILLIPLLRDPVISITEPLGLRISVLISSFMLFFPPLMLLGMVSPYAVKLRTAALDELGTRTGDLYAISTIGSVLAALITGFILIPLVGVVKLTLSVGIILIITASVTYLSGRDRKVRMFFLPFIILVPVIGYIFLPSEKDNPEKGIIAVTQSVYAEIRVMDKDENRFLLIDGGIHTAVNKNTGENTLQYVWVLDILKNIKGFAGEMLLIGLGGGSVLKSFYNDNWDVDVVEIDPEVTETARKYFNISTAFNSIYHRDGREFLKLNEKKYDIIILDAFGSSSVPFHLITVESFYLIKTKLKEEGLAAINIETIGWHDRIGISIAATLKKIFNYVSILPIAEPPDKLGNLIIVASDKPIDLVQELTRDYWNPDYRFSANYERNHAWDNRFMPDVRNEQVLTDDLNPVEVWSERINLQARKELHEALGENSFLW